MQACCKSQLPIIQTRFEQQKRAERCGSMGTIISRYNYDKKGFCDIFTPLFDFVRVLPQRSALEQKQGPIIGKEQAKITTSNMKRAFVV